MDRNHRRKKCKNQDLQMNDLFDGDHEIYDRSLVNDMFEVELDDAGMQQVLNSSVELGEIFDSEIDTTEQKRKKEQMADSTAIKRKKTQQDEAKHSCIEVEEIALDIHERDGGTNESDTTTKNDTINNTEAQGVAAGKGEGLSILSCNKQDGSDEDKFLDCNWLFTNVQSCYLHNENTETGDGTLPESEFCSNLFSDTVEDEFFQDALEDAAFTRATPEKNDMPIYENAQLNYEESMLLIMAYCVRHKLSGVATADLIRLISIHCPKNAKIVANLREFNVFLKALQNPIVRHYYCPEKKCQVYNGTDEPNSKSKCLVCNQTLSKEHFFIELPVYNQLESLLSNGEFLEKLEYRFKRKKASEDCIEDVYDGELYQRLAQKGGFLANPDNLSFLGNTDGVSVVRSTGKSIWPVYLTINELPPLERFSRKNRLFAGIWFGEGKPHFPTFLRPFALSIRSLYSEGITIHQSGKLHKTHKAVFLDMSVDAPARALWMAMKQFNGYFGCGKCKEPGKRLNLISDEKKGKSQCHIFPFDVTNAASTGHATIRMHADVKKQALEAMKNREKGISKPAVEGILGPCWGFGFPTFDVIKGTAIDYMHCICEGVIEQHLDKWFSRTKENVNFPCFIGQLLTEVERDLVKIKPTSEITRKPRKISDRKDWKASEKKAFLLFYAIPVLLGRLPQEYMEHFMLLVGASYRLLKNSITPQDMKEASIYLKLYCAKLAGLYGERFQTFNCHQLLHLVDNVKQLGPLWTHSCFPFEDFNGDLKDLFHGTQNIPSQIVQSVSILQKMPEIYTKTQSQEVKTLYESMMNRTTSSSSRTEKIDERTFVVGALQKLQAVRDSEDREFNEDFQVVVRNHGNAGQLWSFKRSSINNITFHSESYKKVTVRNNYTAMVHFNSRTEFVSVLRYFKVCSPCTEARCALEQKQCSCQSDVFFYAVVRILEPVVPSAMPSLQGNPIISHIVQVMETRRKLAVPLTAIYKKLLRVDVSSGSYVCVMPNTHEKD